MTGGPSTDAAGSAAARLPELTAELGRATLRAVRSSYDELNYDLFKKALSRPTFAWSESKTYLGRWVSGERRLEISESLLLERGWGVLLEVLKHEMVHQYVDEVLKCSDETSHGPAFREICRARGVDARAAGYPGSAEPSSETARLLERVAKLLALAESSNRHEAESAMNAAQRLMLKYNLEAVGHTHSYEFRYFGKPTGRVIEAQRILAWLLQTHFFVDVIWVPVWRPLEGKRGSVLEACGTPQNLELSAYVFDFLNHTAENLWRELKRTHCIRNNAERRTFLAGVMRGFMDKLESERLRHVENGLVWVGDSALRAYYRQRHPRVASVQSGSTAHRSAYSRGREAGRQIVLRRGVSSGPSGGARLLKSR